MDGGANGGGAVDGDIQMERRRDGGAERGDDGHDAVDGLDHVCAGLTEDGDDDAGFSVGKAEIASVLDGVNHFRDVAQAYGSALMAGDNEWLVFVGLKQLIGVSDRPGLFGIGERAFGEVGVGGLQRFANGFQTDSVAIELVRVRFDTDGGTRATPGEDLAHAFHLSNFLGEDRISGIVYLRGWDVVRGQREHQDRGVSRISFSIRRLARKISGKLAASGVDGCLNVARGGVDVAIEIELESNTRGAEPARGSHLSDAGNAAELALERGGDGGGHGLRARAGETGSHSNRWEIDLRERRDRQETERDGSGKKNSNSDQRRGDRPSNEGRGKVGREIHALVSVCG